MEVWGGHPTGWIEGPWSRANNVTAPCIPPKNCCSALANVRRPAQASPGPASPNGVSGFSYPFGSCPSPFRGGFDRPRSLSSTSVRPSCHPKCVRAFPILVDIRQEKRTRTAATSNSNKREKRWRKVVIELMATVPRWDYGRNTRRWRDATVIPWRASVWHVRQIAFSQRLSRRPHVSRKRVCHYMMPGDEKKCSEVNQNHGAEIGRGIRKGRGCGGPRGSWGGGA